MQCSCESRVGVSQGTFQKFGGCTGCSRYSDGYVRDYIVYEICLSGVTVRVCEYCRRQLIERLRLAH